MTSNTDKVRSLFLATLVVLSVFAAGVAFTGSAVAEEQLEDDEWYYQGQELNLSEDSPDVTVPLVEGEKVRLYDNEGVGVQEYTVQEGNYTIIETENLDGEYEVRYNGSSLLNFTVLEQDLEVSFNPDSIDDASTSALELDSKRANGDYNVTLTSDDLSNSDLVDAFQDAEENDDGDVVVPAASGNLSDGAITFDGSQVDPGEYNVTASAGDTTASDSATIEVTEAADSRADFANSVTSVDRGDIATVTIDLQNADSTEVQIGSNNVGYNVTGTVEATDDNNQVTLLVNTFTNNVSAAPDSDTDWNETQGHNLGTPIEAGDYDISVGVDGAGDNADDLGTLVVNDRATNGAASWVAPDSTSLSDLDDVMAAVEAGSLTETESLAKGDKAIAAVDISGVFGLLEANDLAANDNFNVTASQTAESTPPNTDPKSINVTGNVSVIPDQENSTLYLVLDTSNNNISTDEEWELGVTLGEDSPLVSGDEDETAYTTFSVQEASASVNVNSEDIVEVEAAEEQTISGTSTLTPGSEITVRVASSGGSNPFVLSKKVTVAEDGSWEGTFDFSDAEVDQEFTVKLSSFDVEADGMVVEQVGTPTPTATPTPTPTPSPTPTPTATPDDGTPTATEDPGTTAPEDGQPGFGVIVSLIALLGAALLAARRFD